MSIKDCIQQVELFNIIAGNLDNITKQSLVSQAKVIKEEGDELLEAVLEGNHNEILKECVDVLVTIHGFVKMLEQQGYDVLGAWQEVNHNNMTKFSTNFDDVAKTILHYHNNGVETDSYFDEQYGVYVIKDTNGKIRKPYNYKKANVACYTPKGIFPIVTLSEQGEIF